MSSNAKIAAVLVGLVIVIGVGIFISKNRAMAPTSDDELATTTDASATSSASAGKSGSVAGKSGVSSNQSSGASVDKDMATIDAQINTVTSNEADADRGMNDTSIPQTY